MLTLRPARTVARCPARSAGTRSRSAAVALRRVDLARLPRGDGLRRARDAAGSRATSRSTEAPISSRSPRVREGEQRGRVRLRLELGRRRASAWGIRVLPEARLRDPVHAGHGRPRAGRAGRGSRRGRPPLRRRRARPVREARLSSAHVLFPRDAEARARGSARAAPADRRRSTTGRTRATGSIGRLPRPLQREEAPPASKREMRAAGEAAAMTHRDAPAREALLDRRRARDVSLLRAHGRQSSTGASRYLTEGFFSVRRRALRRSPRAGSSRRRSGEPVAGAFNANEGRPPLRPLLGLVGPGSRGEPVPPLQRLLLPLASASASPTGCAVFEPGAGGEHKKARGFFRPSPTRPTGLPTRACERARGAPRARARRPCALTSRKSAPRAG